MLRRKINDPKHWRNRAAAMRALANRANDEETIAIIGPLASDYDKLADALHTSAKLKFQTNRSKAFAAAMKSPGRTGERPGLNGSGEGKDSNLRHGCLCIAPECNALERSATSPLASFSIARGIGNCGLPPTPNQPIDAIANG
jgi:hypothetical protein